MQNLFNFLYNLFALQNLYNLFGTIESKVYSISLESEKPEIEDVNII